MKKILFIILYFLYCSGAIYCQSGVKNILLEEFSTAQCGFCPDGDVIAAQIISNHPRIIWVTHHAGFGTDSMTVPESVTIANAFTNFAPGGLIDRGYYPIPVYTSPPYIAVSRQKWDSVCTAHLIDTPFVDIVITNQYDTISRLLNCTVDATFLNPPSSGDLRLNLFLMEDSVVGYGHGFDQKNYFNTTYGHPYYGAGDTIIGYVHHHVMRNVQTGAWGLSGVFPSSPITGNLYSHTFSNIQISNRWKENDIDVIAFVSYYNSNAQQRKILNSNHLKLKSISTAIKSVNAVSLMTIFPNPASDNLTFSFSDNISFIKINIFSLIGNQEFSSIVTAPQNTIDISWLKPGIYFFEAKSGNKTYREKFIKL
jgi:hypothetical protein